MDRTSTKSGKSPDIAAAVDIFDYFCNAGTLKTIIGYHRHLCNLLNIQPTHFPIFYPKLKSYIKSWKAQALWKKFDARASHKCYNRGKACPGSRVLIIGAGPCGLRTAIEAQLLGAKVVVVEKRDRFSRNNVLHLWPFVIQDLRALGAKKFFGKFCAGSIDHISIRQLQCILLKVALLLGVEVHTEVSFVRLVEPAVNLHEKVGWRALFVPDNHPVSQYEFDVLIGADGRRNTLDGFKRKEFRGKLAIAITSNFINRRTEAEARVEEISGVAFIFNQKFFKDLQENTGIDLENIVYYKDDTHYFVMTAKKQSLLDKGVILQDLQDTNKLLAPKNVDRQALMNYAREAAEYSTMHQMPNMEFAVNHYGEADIAMFDFTSMYAAENASRIIERHGFKLLMMLVGDSLLEPFWPTGSGCARGFLSSLDACWAIRGWGAGHIPLDVIAERESIYRLLAQTTPENLNRDIVAYTLDPVTRYPNLNKTVVVPIQVQYLYDTDDPANVEITKGVSNSRSTNFTYENSKKRRRMNSVISAETLLYWFKRQLADYENVHVENLTTSFKNGLALCAIIHRYRPDLIDYYILSPENALINNQLAFDILEKDLNISPMISGREMIENRSPDELTMLTYLTQVYDTFRGGIPYVNQPNLVEMPEIKRHEKQTNLSPQKIKSIQASLSENSKSGRYNKRHAEHNISQNSSGEKRFRKRKSGQKQDLSLNDRKKKLAAVEETRRIRQTANKRQQRLKQTEQFLKSMQMLQMNGKFDDGSAPFEDYSIYLYRQTAPNFENRVKDLEQKLLNSGRDPVSQQKPQVSTTVIDDEFGSRVRNFEERMKNEARFEKKPKDLIRSIGKIESNDWNVKEIEKKIIENQMSTKTNRERERVPKWNREQFEARQKKLEKYSQSRQDSTNGKYAIIDEYLDQLDLKIKEGSVRQLGSNKVSTITEKFTKLPDAQDDKVPIQKSGSKTMIPTVSEVCDSCQKRVYLMERSTAEGKLFHSACFRCAYCKNILRIGAYTYDREGIYGHKFFCNHHFGITGQLKGTKMARKSEPKPCEEQQQSKMLQEKVAETCDSKSPIKVPSLDNNNRVQTPERVVYSNCLAISPDKNKSPNQIDEDEWTDRNFGTSTTDILTHSDESSDDTINSDKEVLEELDNEPATKEGTLRLAEKWRKHYKKLPDEQNSEDSYVDDDSCSESSVGSYDDDNSSDNAPESTVTECEEDIEARLIRKKEVPALVVPKIDVIAATDETSETECMHNINDKHQKNNEKSIRKSILVIKKIPQTPNSREANTKSECKLSFRPGVEKFFGTVGGRDSLVSSRIPTPKACRRISLPEKYNFEPQQSDLDQLDDYINDLIENEDQLNIPIESCSSSSSTSIENLFEDFETDQNPTKLSDLLNWMKDMNFVDEESSESNSKQAYYNELKYKNLEKLLKRPEKSFINKIPQDSICYFERKMSGNDNMLNVTPLQRSKTDPNLSVSVRNIAKKFEVNGNTAKITPPLPLPLHDKNVKKTVVRKKIKKRVRKSKAEPNRLTLPLLQTSVKQLKNSLENLNNGQNQETFLQKTFQKSKDCFLQ